MNFEKYFNVIGTFCTVMMFIYMIYLNFNTKELNNNKNYIWQKKFVEMKFSGRILKKYIDYNNHGCETFVIDNKKPITVNLSFENSDLFSKISIGDTIIKEENSLKYKILAIF